MFGADTPPSPHPRSVPSNHLSLLLVPTDSAGALDQLDTPVFPAVHAAGGPLTLQATRNLVSRLAARTHRAGELMDAHVRAYRVFTGRITAVDRWLAEKLGTMA